MNKTLIISALVLAGASSAFAQVEAPISREDVKAELALMRANGELQERHLTENYAVELRSVDLAADEAKSREQVRAELAYARSSGLMALWNSDDSAAWDRKVSQG